jgi:hypothetical protein
MSSCSPNKSTPSKNKKASPGRTHHTPPGPSSRPGLGPSSPSPRPKARTSASPREISYASPSPRSKARASASPRAKYGGSPSPRSKARSSASPRAKAGPSTAGPSVAPSSPPKPKPQPRETAALPVECWVNIFQQISEDYNEVNTNVFSVIHANATLPRHASVHTGPHDGRITVLPNSRRHALWNPPPKGHGAVTKVNKGLRNAALTHGGFIFGPGEHDPNPNPDEAGGVYFRWDSDILFLDMDFWRTHFEYQDACYNTWLADRDNWEDQIIRRVPAAARAPDWQDYDPEILPAMLPSHKEQVKHIGLPHRFIWSEARYTEVLNHVYHFFPSVEYFWIYRGNYGKRPKGVGNDVHMSVSKLSLDDKHHLNIRKYFEVWEDPNTGNLARGPPTPNIALKHANELRYKRRWMRDPDVAPRAIRFRRFMTYRPGFPYGYAMPEDPSFVQMLDYFDGDTDLDADSEFDPDDDSDDD